MPYFRSVLRRALQQFAPHAVDIGVDPPTFAAFVPHALELFVINELSAADVEYLLPVGIHRTAGTRAEQPVKAYLKRILSSLPARSESIAHLENFYLVRGLSCVDPAHRPAIPPPRPQSSCSA